ncbi:hypothetical protein K437DRAFT_279681 [Tilletiaria anomala UBC 951]|uniref:Dynactin subunit 6 n=1 Tax=Tilletiaria anomala (strain ATCC 24038 / CBS 436.72 / UBC 951) TaxID=1037660 RepID=A0A066V6E6_TILAU|nr:uncharacterized protein K437DRAFT_279681 [Tilletiaria anomala UBC 951]KDN37317.1 hypothetical protein K437DRAFT_279681 [Tilletiaria anomala UBC 951]
MSREGVANFASTSAEKITVGSKVTIAQDTDIRGNVTFGTETVVHPKAAILALRGPIVIGSGCIIEEGAVIVNRRENVMRIGDYNYFEIGSRVEAASVGSHNVFEVRSFVSSDVMVESFCTVGAGCVLAGNPVWPLDAEGLLKEEHKPIFQEEESICEGAGDGRDKTEKPEAEEGEQQERNKENDEVEAIPDRTVIYGHDSRRRLWSGEGVQQAAAVHVKHLDYLREALPKSVRLKLIS